MRSYGKCLCRLGGLLLLIFLSLENPLMSQSYQLKPLEVRFGVGGGVSGSILYLVPQVVQQPHVGGMGYVSLLLTNQKYTGMTMRLSYEQRGFRERYMKPIAYTFSRDMDFIDFTLMTHLYYPIGAYQIGLEIGPSVGYILRDVSSPTPEGETRPIVRRRHLHPLQSRWSLGLKGGPTLSVDLQGGHRISLSGYFYYGLSDLFATTARDDYSRASEMSITVGIGYFFKL